MQLNVPREQAFKRFDARIKSYGNGEFVVKEYERTLKKKLPGFEEPGSDYRFTGSTTSGRKSSAEVYEVRADNLTRTRNRLFDLVITNKHEWQSFITLTFAENLGDINKANKKFANWVRQMRRACTNLEFEFKYLGVPEYQKRGAVHYHLLTNLNVDSEMLPKQKNRFGKRMYDVKYWNHGFTSAFDLTSTDDNFNVALYIAKYLYKDLDQRLYGRNKILKTNGLLEPVEREYLTSDPMYEQALEYILENAYDVGIKKYEPSKENPFAVGFTQSTFKTHLD